MAWLSRAVEIATAVATVVGIVVPIASLVCSVANAWIRSAVEHGYRVPHWLRFVGSALNLTALNLDKVPQMARGYRGRSLPPPPTIPLPEDQP
jgi:hypothetical protein